MLLDSEIFSKEVQNISARILTCPDGSLSPMLPKLLQALLASILNPSVAIFHMAIMMSFASVLDNI